jgi:hypothetical protein
MGQRFGKILAVSGDAVITLTTYSLAHNPLLSVRSFGYCLGHTKELGTSYEINCYIARKESMSILYFFAFSLFPVSVKPPNTFLELETSAKNNSCYPRSMTRTKAQHLTQSTDESCSRHLGASDV